ncbi:MULTISPECIES: galactose ABC transporter substrate-binding protein [Clostridium]|uniref:D-galactose/methyl-galactoside binding periplasmic protein MglB n=1 Tax=Clostridium cibarium TaxID=2762247 RepID=A0ABR8PV83_9CLOT|nr:MULTISPECIES: galactose ABC transporter substrate-binding protein [Clostridium]MBD7912053.1 galactose ABC transporter substrate-binding protein [Clostridium cibarium]
MKLKKEINIVIIILLIIIIQNNSCIYPNAITENQVNVAVLISNPEDPFLDLIIEGLKKGEESKKNNMEFTFFDTKKNQSIEAEILDNILKNNFDLILGNLVDTKVDTIENFIFQIRQKNVPAILFNSEPSIITDEIRNYKKFVIVTTDPKEAGILQGKLIADQWNKNKSTMDKNKDNIMNYVMLQGAINNVGAIERTKYSISTINNLGIKTQELSKSINFWNQQLAKESVSSLFLKYGNKIEVIISNNDAMAIGAIEALQYYGYNKGDPTKVIPVFGIDGIPAAQELIKKGVMTGTVFENINDTVEALYKVGLNLVYNKSPLENTSYKFSNGETVITIPYQGVITS